MAKLPKSIRFFRKPDHISFLIGYPIILSVIPTNSETLKIIGMIFLSFTLCYEIYEITKGNRQIVKLDHITYVIAYIILIVTFWYDFQILLIISSTLLGFTFVYEIYTVRKNDLKNQRKNI